MRKHIMICILVVVLASCGNSKQKKGTSKTTEESIASTTTLSPSEKASHYCYLRTEGTNNQDTTIVQFTVDGDRVEGVMNWIPAEKDSRKGVLTGAISGDEIRATWNYSQEGLQDSIVMAFKLASQQLTQKPLTVDPTTGQQETDEVADYSIIYTVYDCKD